MREVWPRLTWSPKATTGRWVVHAGRLVDGRTSEPRSDVDIVIVGNRIDRVESHRDALHTGRVLDASQETVVTAWR